MDFYQLDELEKKIPPLPILVLIAPRNALMGCPSIVGVVVMINLSIFKRF